MSGDAIREVGVQRVSVSGGFCWHCQQPAVSGERLPGKRRKTRLLCKRHDRLTFGGSVEPGQA